MSEYASAPHIAEKAGTARAKEHSLTAADLFREAEDAAWIENAKAESGDTRANKPPLISRDPQNQGGVYLQAIFRSRFWPIFFARLRRAILMI